jgi:membrane protein DedA with SNARE-associated domain
MEPAFTWIASYGYAAIFGLLVLGIVGLPVPDETLLTFVGYLSFRGDLMLAPSLASAFLGSACGISISYALGRFAGPTMLTKLSGTLQVNPEHITRAQQWVQRWGKYALVIAYFVPGVRHFAALMAGVAKMPLGTFARFAYVGALLWSSTFILVGYWLGEEWSRLSPSLHRSLLLFGLAMGVLLVAGLVVLKRRSRASEPNT